MLRTLANRTPILVDTQMLPRYWACVWSLLHGGGLAPSTLARKLRHIDALYEHAEQVGISLDDAIAALDFHAVGNVLEAFFVSQRNVQNPSSQALARWNTAFHFVRDLCDRVARDPVVGRQLDDVREKISSLDKLYLGLRPRRKSMTAAIRALPSEVVTELLDAAEPGSTTNPFESETTQWRMYCLVVLLLFQGLRRGEALVLRADSLTSQRARTSGEFRWLLKVSLNTDGDTRRQVPSIKTVDSIRTLPVTSITANIIQTYLENHRGKANHSYLLSSMRRLPLSIEGVNKAFQKLSQALSPSAHQTLHTLTGASSLTPHSLRHTCAVLRMKQMLAMGQTPEQAMSQLRSFFGWSKTSVMPLHYAKAALDERLNETWNNKLDERLEILKGLRR